MNDSSVTHMTPALGGDLSRLERVAEDRDTCDDNTASLVHAMN